VLDGSRQVLRDVAMATNFGTQFAITGFVGYNFGCMIASGTLFDSRGGFLGSNYLMKRRCHGKHFWFHWRHLVNTTEPSVCGGNAALCQIT